MRLTTISAAALFALGITPAFAENVSDVDDANAVWLSGAWRF